MNTFLYYNYKKKKNYNICTLHILNIFKTESNWHSCLSKERNKDRVPKKKEIYAKKQLTNNSDT